MGAKKEYSMTSIDPLKTTPIKVPQPANGSLQAAALLRQYGCGPIPFVGTENAFYERHLVFDRAIDPEVATARERFEAFAHSIRDILAQRWVLTKKTYERINPKRIYYLSMEFLIGRSTATNITNLLLDPLVQQAAKEKGLDWLNLIEEEPDAGLGNGGLGRLAACFLDSMATMQLPATGYGCDTSTACSSSRLWTAGRRRAPTTGFASAIPGKLRVRPKEWKSS